MINCHSRCAKKGISFSPEIEILLLLVVMVISLFSTGDAWVNSPLKVLMMGSAVIVGFYIHFLLVGIIGGWLVTRFLKTGTQTRRREHLE